MASLPIDIQAERATATGAAIAEQLDAGRLARWALAVCLLLGLLGQLPNAGVPNTSPFDLDSEYWFASTWSALLLLAAAYAAVTYGKVTGGRAAVGLGCFLAFMATDEFVSVHERVEAAAGIDWQILYLPLVLLGAVMCLLVVREQWEAGRWASVRLLLGGGILWSVAQILEKVQWDGDRQVSGYAVLSTIEELFEMAGSLLFGLAMLIALQAVRHGRGVSAARA
jgi:hypothetical protein